MLLLLYPVHFPIHIVRFGLLTNFENKGDKIIRDDIYNKKLKACNKC